MEKKRRYFNYRDMLCVKLTKTTWSKWLGLGSETKTDKFLIEILELKLKVKMDY